VKESRAATGEWEAKERDMTAELNKLRGQVTLLERMRRDHTELLKALQSARDKLEAANADNTAMRAKLHAAEKAKETHAALASTLQAQVGGLSARAGTAATATGQSARAERAVCS
jgi:hypothetical protein